MQVDPIGTTLKAPGTKLLKLQHDRPLSNSAFKFNTCRYTTVVDSDGMRTVGGSGKAVEADYLWKRWLKGLDPGVLHAAVADAVARVQADSPGETTLWDMTKAARQALKVGSTTVSKLLARHITPSQH